MTIAGHPDLEGKLVDITRTKALDILHGSVLWALDRQDHDDSVMERMFGMAKLKLRIWFLLVTDDEMKALVERYPLIDSATFLCKTDPTFLEHVDDDEPIADKAMDFEEYDDDVDKENSLMVFDHDNDEA